jgi:hypothetical protein
MFSALLPAATDEATSLDVSKCPRMRLVKADTADRLLRARRRHRLLARSLSESFAIEFATADREVAADAPPCPARERRPSRSLRARPVAEFIKA